MKISTCLLTGMMLCATASACFAEDVVLQVYAQVPGVPGGWAVTPSVTTLADAAPNTLFEALKRKKKPTYGDTTFDAKTGTVTIDATKCAYLAIISTELQKTFEYNGLTLKSVVCAGRATAPQSGALVRSANVAPVWLALTPSGAKPAPDTWVDLGDSLVRWEAFDRLVAAKDKNTMKAIETAFDSPNEFVQRQTMSAAVTAKVPNAEAWVAKRLGAKDVMTRANAIRALKTTSNAKLVKQMRDQVTSCVPAECLTLAEAALGAADATLSRQASLAMLASPATDAFNVALAALAPDVLGDNLDTVLKNVAAPQHASLIAKKLVGTNETPLRDWLKKQVDSSVSTAVATTVVAAANAQPATQVAAHGILLLGNDFDLAERSFWAITNVSLFDVTASPSLATDQVEALQRAQAARDPLVRIAAFDVITPLPPVDQNFDVVAAQKRAFDLDATRRKAVANELVAANDSADAVRTALIKDREPAVVQAMVDSLCRTGASRYARELINLAKTQDEATRRVILRAMPALLDADQANAISAFVSNELFDPSSEIRITALHALAQIARLTKDPVIADNAITSISMTLQDKDPRIQKHTRLALEETGSEAAKAMLNQ